MVVNWVIKILLHLHTVGHGKYLSVRGRIRTDNGQVIPNSLEHVNANIIPATQEVTVRINTKNISFIVVMLLGNGSGNRWSLRLGPMGPRNMYLVYPAERN